MRTLHADSLLVDLDTLTRAELLKRVHLTQDPDLLLAFWNACQSRCQRYGAGEWKVGHLGLHDLDALSVEADRQRDRLLRTRLTLHSLGRQRLLSPHPSAPYSTLYPKDSTHEHSPHVSPSRRTAHTASPGQRTQRRTFASEGEKSDGSPVANPQPGRDDP